MPTEPASSSPLAILWRPAAVGAVVLGGEALALVLALASPESGDWLVRFGLASLAAQWVGLGTLCALYLLRRPLACLTPLHVAWAGFAVLLAMSLLVAEAGWAVANIAGGAPGQRAVFVARAMALAVIVGLAGLLAFKNHWQARQLAVRARELELAALHARIRPHFLFNTLNTGAALVHARPDEAERVLLDLADLFRSALRGPQLVPLEEELTLARRYLDIEALRFGDRLVVAWDLPAQLPDIDVPSLSIQPLVENAVRHGIEPSAGGGCIAVTLQDSGAFVELTVSNPIPSNTRRNEGHALGLSSSRLRVRELMGGQVQTAIDGDRFVATLRIPARSGPAQKPGSA